MSVRLALCSVCRKMGCPDQRQEEEQGNPDLVQRLLSVIQVAPTHLAAAPSLCRYGAVTGAVTVRARHQRGGAPGLSWSSRNLPSSLGSRSSARKRKLHLLCPAKPCSAVRCPSRLPGCRRDLCTSGKRFKRQQLQCSVSPAAWERSAKHFSFYLCRPWKLLLVVLFKLVLRRLCWEL